MLKKVKESAYIPLAGKLQRCFLSQSKHCQDKVRGQPLVSSIVSLHFPLLRKKRALFLTQASQTASLPLGASVGEMSRTQGVTASEIEAKASMAH